MIHFFKNGRFRGYTYNDGPNVRTFVFNGDGPVATQYNRDGSGPDMLFSVNGDRHHLTSRYSVSEGICDFLLDGHPVTEPAAAARDLPPITVATYPRSGKFWLHSMLVPFLGKAGYAVAEESEINEQQNLMSLAGRHSNRFNPRNGYYTISHLAHQPFPGKRVFLKRDPRDQIVSNAMFHGGAKIYLEGETSFSLDDMLWLFIRGGDKFVDIRTSCEQQLKWFTDETVYSVSYEALTRDVRGTLSDLMQHLEVDLDVLWIPLEAVINLNSFENVTGRKRGDERVRYHRKAIVGDYREKLSTDMLDDIYERAGDLIEALGYTW